MRKYSQYLLILILVLGLPLTACSGEGISGSASGSRQSLRSGPDGGTAEGSFKKVKGTFGASFETSAGSDEYVYVDLTASVETGGLRIFLKDPEGSISEITLEPGQSGSLAGEAALDFDDEFKVYFEAVGEEAGGIDYSLTYQHQD
jgi:hypothetical protein